jgi:hypothetical protein
MRTADCAVAGLTKAALRTAPTRTLAAPVCNAVKLIP